MKYHIFLQYDLPFVEVYRAKEFTFRASELKSQQQQQPKESESDIETNPNPNPGIKSQLSSSALSVWNCDGEVIDATSVKIRYSTLYGNLMKFPLGSLRLILFSDL